ncbi:MAG: sigma-70 family RNA polymerase sigma factor [Planctomycetes bacterium]|nr:sigma-70 family RNA polymerase sigma factor [Planctomycetota bacterium]
MNAKIAGRRRRTCMMAMVLGTAISAMGSSSAHAGADISPAAIDNVARYCTACWRNARLPADRWGECTQEVFSRLLTTVDATGWQMLLARDSEQRRELIRAIDAVKKQVARERKRTVPLTSVVDDDRDTFDRARAEVRDEVQLASEQLLSDRQRRIIDMTFDGWSVQDISRELALGTERVSDEKYKAVRKLREYFGRQS